MAERSELQIAIQAARAAGGLLRDNFKKKLSVQYKSVIEPVTELDHQSERMIATILNRAYPNYGLLAEEDHHQVSEKESYWVVDPLDGTTNYAHGVPAFAVSIALLKGGQMEIGVVYSPLNDELFLAQRDQGAWLDWQPIRVSSTAKLGRALLASGFPYDTWSNPRDNLAEWAYFNKHALTPRCTGCASLDLCFVAAGRFDGYWELDLQPWDMAAGALIVEEAGGVVTALGGQAYDPLGRTILAANPKIHKQMLEGLGQVKSAGE